MDSRDLFFLTSDRGDGEPVADVRFCHSVNSRGDRAVVLKAKEPTSSTPDSDVRFECQQWDIHPDRVELRESQALSVPRSEWNLYLRTAPTDLRGRIAPVAFSADLEVFRVGPRVFLRSAQDVQGPKPLDLDVPERYVEELTMHDAFIAVTERRDIPEPTDDVKDETNSEAEPDAAASNALEEPTPSDQLELVHIQQSLGSDGHRSAIDTPATTVSEPDVAKEIADDDLEAESARLKRASSELSDVESLVIDGSDGESDDANSATLSWSDGSTDVSSEIEDFEDNELDSDDLEYGADDVNDSDSEISVADSVISQESSELSIIDDDKRSSLDIDDDDAASVSVESHLSEGYYSDEEDSEADENQDGKMLETYATRGKRGEDDTLKVSLRIYFTQIGLKCVFHFDHYVKNNLEASPAVFHPTAPLVVWPLGSNRILFADYGSNSFFVRLLGCSLRDSVQISVAARFADDGASLHFAALEAALSPKRGQRNAPDRLTLNLQVTTHRLSRRKTTRAPPKLVQRTNVFLGEVEKLDVSKLPYALTWSTDALYVSAHELVSNIVRVHLTKRADGAQVEYLSTKRPSHLPFDLSQRSCRYFPRSSETGSARLVSCPEFLTLDKEADEDTDKDATPPFGIRLEAEHGFEEWRSHPSGSASGEKAMKIDDHAGALREVFEARASHWADALPLLS